MIALQTFTTAQDVKTYLAALHAADLLYNIDDEPAECLENLEQKELANICANHEAMHTFCEVNGLEIWDSFPEAALS